MKIPLTAVFTCFLVWTVCCQQPRGKPKLLLDGGIGTAIPTNSFSNTNLPTVNSGNAKVGVGLTASCTYRFSEMFSFRASILVSKNTFSLGEGEQFVEAGISEETFFIEHKLHYQPAFRNFVMSAGLGRPFDIGKFSAEPYLTFGLGLFDLDIYETYGAKEIGSNYTQQVNVFSEYERQFSLAFSPGLDLRYQLDSWVGLTLHSGLIFQKGKETIFLDRRDLLQNYSRETLDFSGNFEMMMLTLGLHLIID